MTSASSLINQSVIALIVIRLTENVLSCSTRLWPKKIRDTEDMRTQECKVHDPHDSNTQEKENTFCQRVGEEFKVGKGKLAYIYIYSYIYVIYSNMNQKKLTSSVGQRWLSADDFES